MLQSLIPHIECVPDKCGGKPVVAGTRVRVWDIYVQHELKGQSVSEVMASFPELSVAQIHAALSYYYDNKEAIDLQMKQAADSVEELRNALGPGPLARKLAATDADSDSVSS